MSSEKPTPEGGASITERLETLLSAGEGKQDEVEGQEAAPESPEVVEDQASDAQEQDEGPQISLTDAAKILGVDESAIDVDEDGTIKFKTKIDGKEGAAKFNDLLKSYQLQGHVDAKVREAAAKQQELTERVNQFEQFAVSESQRLNQMAQLAHQVLMRDAAQVDWDDLAANDLAGYVQKKHEFDTRQGQVNQLVQAANEQVQNFQQAKAYWEQRQLAEEAQRIPTLIPEWADAKVAQTERDAMVGWLQTIGATPQGIAGLRDAGIVAALRKAFIASKTGSAASAVEKKVKAAPRLVRPGSPTDANQRTNETVKGLKETIRKSEGRRGVADYLIATGKV